ncbi:sensor histidine kinase [Pseudomonas ceruminis]|uniref:sensor histidine kinase n=1 Tax=Pseudomonas putida group TaxID=136845 RepID=UPI003D00B3A1
MTFSAYEQGTLSLETVNLVELAETVVSDIAPLAVSAGYDISLEAEFADLWFNDNALSVKRAAGNLVQNAINHGGQSGAITVRVGASANIDVIDEGPGIAQSEHERVFEPFHRLKNDGRGVGLGLDVVQRIMHAHGGHAELVAGAMSSGAHFRLRFESARTAPATT